MKHVSQTKTIKQTGKSRPKPTKRTTPPDTNWRRNRENELHELRSKSHKLFRRWATDRDALLAENAWTCGFCGRQVQPRILDRATCRWVEPDGWDGLSWQNVQVIRRDRCGCEAEREHAAVQARMAQEQMTEDEAARKARALRNAGLEGWLAIATFKGYEQRTPQQSAALRACVQYGKDLLTGNLGDRPWLVLHGGIGLGKSHLAAALVRVAVERGWTGVYFRFWLSYLNRLRASFGEDPPERTVDVTRELASGRLVVIDDVDNERGRATDFEAVELFRVIDERYTAELPTVFTFNQHPLKMSPYLTRAGVDRLEHYARKVELSGLASYRSGQEW
jgi:DNA replication protein DnaC